MPTTMRPLADQVLLRRDAAESKTAAGIFIPETAKEKPQTAIVVAVGPGRVLDSGQRVEPRVQAGERVWLAKWAGTEVEINGEKLLVVRESDLLGVDDSQRGPL